MALKLFKDEYINETGKNSIISIDNEMRIMSQLDHPNILKLLDYGYNG